MKGRWALLTGIDIGADGDPYLDRLRLVQTPRFAVYLHHIHRPDKEPHPHDHPWAFASLVLCGAYSESVWPDKTVPGDWAWRHRPRWSLRRLNRDSAHIITDVTGPLWTLVIAGRDHDEWGFWANGKHIPWREYLAQGNGKRARR